MVTHLLRTDRLICLRREVRQARADFLSAAQIGCSSSPSPMSSREEKQALLPVTESFSTPPRSAIPVRKTALLTALLASLVVLGWSRNGIASSEHETIKWTSCGSGLECGTLEVPLDWADPASSQKVAVALARLPASSKEARLGSLILYVHCMLRVYNRSN